MIDVSEHVYHDDPAVGHPDVRTCLAGASYFFLGDGLIQAAVQYAPCGEGSPYGLLVMDPDRLRPKRGALSFDDRAGLQPTMLHVRGAGGTETASPPDLVVEWDSDADVPTVCARWHTGTVAIDERFFCPDLTEGRLLRVVRLRAGGGGGVALQVSTACGGQVVERRVALAAGGETTLAVEYRLTEDRRAVEIAAAAPAPPGEDARRWWGRQAQIEGLAPGLDALFRTAARQLPAIHSRRGVVDASIWQYAREWVRDHAFAARALAALGCYDRARVVLDRLLREFVSPDGSPVDSGEQRASDEAELDQNGVLLVCLHDYVAWSGDLDLCRERWHEIETLAEFPLRPVFRHDRSGLLFNRREFWERHAAHGIEPGFELIHQVFVSLGLEAAAALATRLGQGDCARRWAAEAATLRNAALHDPVFALVDARGFVKRRGLDGSVQETIAPCADAGLPPGVPLAGHGDHPLNPDTSTALAIASGFVPATSALARRTLEHLDAIWNQGWTIGGYGRYHRDSEPDSPGPWPFASLFVARAALDAGDHDRAWRVVEWLQTIPGSASGAWFEVHGPRVSPPYPQVGIIPWAWAEAVDLVIGHVLGVRPGLDTIAISPRRLGPSSHLRCRLPYRGDWIDLAVDFGASPAARRVVTDARVVSDDGTTLVVAPPGRGFRIEISREG